MHAQKPSSRLRRNLRLCAGEGVVAVPLVFISMPGNFVVAALLTSVFKIDEASFGLIASLPSWANILQLFIVPALNRAWPSKYVNLAFGWAHLACWAALALAMPHLPAGTPGAYAFTAFFALSSLFQAILGVSWQSWVQEWTPERIRGKYFGNRNRLVQAGIIGFLLAVGWLTDRMGNSIPAYQILICGAIVLRAGSLLAQHRILSSSPARRPEAATPWLAQLAVLRRERPLLTFLAFTAAFSFSTNAFGVFSPVFVYEQLHKPVSFFSTLVVISSLAGAVAMPAWGALQDRHGNKPVMLLCYLLWQTQNYLWAALTPDNAWLLYGMWAFGGATASGFFQGMFSILLKLVPAECKTLAISANLAVGAAAASLGPIAGGLFIQAGRHAGFEPLDIYHAGFALGTTLALLSSAILVSVEEKGSAHFGAVVGAMRSFRQIGALLGLGFLVNHVFFKPRDR